MPDATPARDSYEGPLGGLPLIYYWDYPARLFISPGRRPPRPDHFPHHRTTRHHPELDPDAIMIPVTL